MFENVSQKQKSQNQNTGSQVQNSKTVKKKINYTSPLNKPPLNKLHQNQASNVQLPQIKTPYSVSTKQQVDSAFGPKQSKSRNPGLKQFNSQPQIENSNVIIQKAQNVNLNFQIDKRNQWNLKINNKYAPYSIYQTTANELSQQARSCTPIHQKLKPLNFSLERTKNLVNELGHRNNTEAGEDSQQDFRFPNYSSKPFNYTGTVNSPQNGANLMFSGKQPKLKQYNSRDDLKHNDLNDKNRNGKKGQGLGANNTSFKNESHSDHTRGYDSMKSHLLSRNEDIISYSKDSQSQMFSYSNFLSDLLQQNASINERVKDRKDIQQLIEQAQISNRNNSLNAVSQIIEEESQNSPANTPHNHRKRGSELEQKEYFLLNSTPLKGELSSQEQNPSEKKGSTSQKKSPVQDEAPAQSKNEEEKIDASKFKRNSEYFDQFLFQGNQERFTNKENKDANQNQSVIDYMSKNNEKLETAISSIKYHQNSNQITVKSPDLTSQRKQEQSISDQLLARINSDDQNLEKQTTDELKSQLQQNENQPEVLRVQQAYLLEFESNSDRQGQDPTQKDISSSFDSQDGLTNMILKEVLKAEDLEKMDLNELRKLEKEISEKTQKLDQKIFQEKIRKEELKQSSQMMSNKSPQKRIESEQYLVNVHPIIERQSSLEKSEKDNRRQRLTRQSSLEIKPYKDHDKEGLHLDLEKQNHDRDYSMVGGKYSQDDNPGGTYQRSHTNGIMKKPRASRDGSQTQTIKSSKKRVQIVDSRDFDEDSRSRGLVSKKNLSALSKNIKKEELSIEYLRKKSVLPPSFNASKLDGTLQPVIEEKSRQDLNSYRDSSLHLSPPPAKNKKQTFNFQGIKNFFKKIGTTPLEREENELIKKIEISKSQKLSARGEKDTPTFNRFESRDNSQVEKNRIKVSHM